MQKAKLVVEYRNKEKVEYTVLFQGYATQRKLYLKRVSHCEKNCEEIRYVTVARRDTRPFREKLEKVDISRVMAVSDSTGLMDARIKEVKRLHDIALIEQANL